MNQAWECPRCHRMNAPFNPTCFCSPDNGDLEISAKTPQNSEHVMDAARYLRPDLDPGQLYKILEGEKRKADIINGMIPNFYDGSKTKVNLPQNPCGICGGKHWAGFECATLSQNTLEPNGQFI